MELRQIQYFLETARCLNFTQAASNLFVSQSTLSEQINKLEQDLKCQLFERNGKKIRLTEEGEFMRSRCEQIVKYMADTIDGLQDIRNGLRGKIKIGALPTIALSWLPPFIVDFLKEFPGIQCSIKELGSSKIEESIKNYEIDLGITTLPSKETSFLTSVLYVEKLVLIIPEHHRFASLPKHSLDFKDFKDEPFIIYEKGFQLREIILNGFFKAGYQPNIVMEVERTESIKYLVESGYGVALVPETCITNRQPGYPNYFLLRSPLIRTVGLLTRQHDLEFLAINTLIARLLQFDYSVLTRSIEV
ncbi:LysR family transcriptional regulator [Fodinisporobacter ferrooxydans]|uniref:LysR family transcriptional regulator n=1 Tax=Fodinisporobacter ferrooxydans TaxID=2901836 RepID=A0ABY4CF23_9BACL|nr:LysR family transcriptional regulator [Alicyclobacillaceae bacterium MYW30-H2]